VNVRRLAISGVLVVALAACGGARTAPLPSEPTAMQRSAFPALASENPMRADDFVDSIGVNTHLIDDLTADGEYTLVEQRMKELGVRHVRDGIFPEQTPKQYRDERNFLAATGARMEAITDCPQPLGYYPHSQTPPGVIRGFDAAIGGRVELVEGPNEPDLRKVRGWAPLLIACTKNLKLDRTLPLPFVASAMGNAFNSKTLGNISQLVDIGAIHRYFSGYNPGNDGFWKSNACGTWGQMSFSICEARINSGPTKPLYVTETGWSTFGEIDEKSEGKYIARVLLIDSLAGIVRTYLYELHDDGTDATNSENGYGLFRYDGTPKPAFDAVRAEIGLLTDRGPSFTPVALRYAVRGVPSTRHELFQKRDGTYVVAVWNEKMSWNPNTARDIPVAPVAVTLAFASPPRVVRCLSLDDAGKLVAQTPSIAGNDVTLQVDDHVSFVILPR
jgi:hypothetical protein